MRSKVLLGLCISSGLALLVAGAGCSDGGGDTTGSGGTGGSGGAAQSSSSSTSVAQSSSTGMVIEDSNKDCDSAEILALDDPGLQDTLDPIDTDSDYFRFVGEPGKAILLSTDAKPPQDEFDPTYPDLVLTLYKKEADGTWTQIAENDDPFPRSSNDSALYTILPASQDNEYCMRVTECNVWVGGAAGCAPSADITTYDYAVGGGILDPSLDSIADEKEPNDEAMTATPIEYSKNMQSGNYYVSLSWGGYSSASDIDVWSFNVPADAVAMPKGRTICNFDFYPGGVDGSGSTATQGVMAHVTTAADPATKIAEIEVTASATPAQISMPCDAATDYLFFMTRKAGSMAGANDFYFMNHVATDSNPLEMGPNDDIMMPEALTATPNGTTTSYFVDGDLDMAPMDIDYYSVDVPMGVAQISVACGAERSGSGLRGLKVSILGANDMPIMNGIATESATKDLFIQGAAIPGGTSSLKIKIEAGQQAADVTSTFYRCGIHLSPAN